MELTGRNNDKEKTYMKKKDIKDHQFDSLSISFSLW